jgi:hypothetical protein
MLDESQVQTPIMGAGKCERVTSASLQKSKYLMIPNVCDTQNLSITQFQFFNENLVIPSIQHLV